MWLGLTGTEPEADPSTENTETNLPTSLSGPALHLLDRSVNSHRETSSPWLPTHEAHSMVSQRQLDGTGIT